MRFLLLLLGLSSLGASAFGGELTSSVDAAALPAAKRTSLGLYLTPADAAAALEADPDILFLDTRDPIEIMFVGHPIPIDSIVPLEVATHAFDADAGAYELTPNAGFVDDVEAVMARDGLGKNHPVIVLCRSGGRSAKAAEELIEAGYTNVWNLVEGFEGDTDEAGRRGMNGWRNAGLPWTHKLTSGQAWTPRPPK